MSNVFEVLNLNFKFLEFVFLFLALFHLTYLISIISQNKKIVYPTSELIFFFNLVFLGILGRTSSTGRPSAIFTIPIDFHDQDTHLIYLLQLAIVSVCYLLFIKKNLFSIHQKLLSRITIKLPVKYIQALHISLFLAIICLILFIGFVNGLSRYGSLGSDALIDNLFISNPIFVYVNMAVGAIFVISLFLFSYKPFKNTYTTIIISLSALISFFIYFSGFKKSTIVNSLLLLVLVYLFTNNLKTSIQARVSNAASVNKHLRPRFKPLIATILFVSFSISLFVFGFYIFSDNRSLGLSQTNTFFNMLLHTLAGQVGSSYNIISQDLLNLFSMRSEYLDIPPLRWFGDYKSNINVVFDFSTEGSTWVGISSLTQSFYVLGIIGGLFWYTIIVISTFMLDMIFTNQIIIRLSQPLIKRSNVDLLGLFLLGSYSQFFLFAPFVVLRRPFDVFFPIPLIGRVECYPIILFSTISLLLTHSCKSKHDNKT